MSIAGGGLLHSRRSSKDVGMEGGAPFHSHSYAHPYLPPQPSAPQVAERSHSVGYGMAHRSSRDGGPAPRASLLSRTASEDGDMLPAPKARLGSRGSNDVIPEDFDPAPPHPTRSHQPAPLSRLRPPAPQGSSNSFARRSDDLHIGSTATSASDCPSEDNNMKKD